jgi:non-heme Fe2+,alpha-ketoglutarate-dependent halogenase
MRVIPGTHTSPQLEHEDTFDDHNLLTRGQKLKQDPDAAKAVDLVLQPGEISLHQLMLVHGSEPNRTDDRRIGLVIRYIAPNVSQKGGIPDSAMLVRGKDTYGNFNHERAPAADMHPDAVAHHAEIMKQHQALKYAGTDRGYR